MNHKNINMDGVALIMIFLKLYKKNPRTTQKFTPYKTSNLMIKFIHNNYYV